MHSHIDPKQSRAAFSLVELLITVAIISVLCTLGLAGLNRASSMAQRSKCANNLRELGVAFRLFTGENNNLLPGQGTGPTNRWIQQVAPYLQLDPATAYNQEIFHCPLVPRSGFLINNWNAGDGCYGYPLSLSSYGQIIGMSLLQIVNPSTKVLLAEKSYAVYKGIGTGGGGPVLTVTRPFPPDATGVAANHREDKNPGNGPNGFSNYLFMDGHVETLQAWPGAAAFDPKQY